MTSRGEHFPRLSPAELTEAQRELHRAITGGRRASANAIAALTDDAGHLAGPFNAMLFAPAVGTAVQALGERIRFDLSMPDRERELATLLVAGRLRCPYEIAAHRRLCAAAGVTADEIADLTAGRLPKSATGREATFLRLVEQLCDERVDDEVLAAALSTVGHQGVVELTILVGYYRTLALLLATCGGNDDD